MTLSFFTVVSAIMLLISASVMFWISWKVLHFWHKSIREEALVHFALMFLYFATILAILAVSLVTIIPFPIIVSYKDTTAIVGVLYDIFYLELSFFYLALFSNSRRFIEKYIPLFVGGAIGLALAILLTQSESLFILAFLLHVIVIIAGLSLLVQMYFRFQANEKYFTRQEDLEFLQMTKKITILTFLILIPDGLGFLGWLYFSIVITEHLLLVIGLTCLVLGLLSYFLAKILARKAEGCDFTNFFNVLS